jgi:hypothetical protein
MKRRRRWFDENWQEVRKYWEWGIQTLISVYNLASLLHSKGQYDAASELYQRAIAGYQKMLGSHHPTSLACSRDYSSMLDELNQRGPSE